MNENIVPENIEISICGCGCYGVPNFGKIFIYGHQNRGKNNPMYGKKRLDMIGENNLSNRPEIRKKRSDDWLGDKNPMNRPEIRAKILGENNHFYGKHHTKEAKEKNRKSQLELKRIGEKAPNWRGGISFEPYCIKFDEDLKERVREFFGRKCILCGKNEQEQIDEMLRRNKRPATKLGVHHVNYDKMVCCNDVKPLFVPLCISCHSKTNGNRINWEKLFTEIIMNEYNGQCFILKRSCNVVEKQNLISK